MIFTASIFTSNSILILLASLLWAFIVLSIDRYIVSSIDKGESIYEDIFSFKFLIRILLAIGIGIAVSHPIVIYYFSDIIEKERLSQDGFLTKNLEKELKLETASLIYRDSIERSPFVVSLNKTKREINCALELLSAEASGDKGFVNSCGQAASGEYGQGTSYDALQDKLNQLRLQENQELETLKQYDSQKADQQSVLNENFVRKQEQQELQFVNGYSRRQKILDDLSDDDDDIRTTKYFILFFLILVDITPVLLKTLTQRGPYDKLKPIFSNHSVSSTKNYLQFVEQKDRKLTKTNLQLMIGATDDFVKDNGDEKYDFPVLLHFLLKRQLITTYNLFYRIFNWQKTTTQSKNEVLPNTIVKDKSTKSNEKRSTLDKVLKFPYDKLIEASTTQKFIERLIISLFTAALTFAFGSSDSLQNKGLAALGVFIFTIVASVVFTKFIESDDND
jgi:hypothetical protein